MAKEEHVEGQCEGWPDLNGVRCAGILCVPDGEEGACLEEPGGRYGGWKRRIQALFRPTNGELEGWDLAVYPIE